MILLDHFLIVPEDLQSDGVWNAHDHKHHNFTVGTSLRTLIKLQKQQKFTLHVHNFLEHMSSKTTSLLLKFPGIMIISSLSSVSWPSAGEK